MDSNLFDSTSGLVMPVRIVPMLLCRNSLVVRSEKFGHHTSLGPFDSMLKRLASWSVDEILILDISGEMESEGKWHSRWDRRAGQSLTFLSFISQVADSINIPLTVGGRIRNVDDALNYLKHGADRVSVNSMLFTNPYGVSELISEVGAQAVVASLDVKQVTNMGEHRWTLRSPASYEHKSTLESMLRLLAEIRPGELLIQSVDDDGQGSGFNVELAAEIQRLCAIPLMLASGAGSIDHFVEAAHAGVRALVAANMWHFKELVGPRIKTALLESGIAVRIVQK